VWPVSSTGIHGLPETPVPVGGKLAISGQAGQWLLFQHAVLVQVVQRCWLKEEETDIDPPLEFRLLTELHHESMVVNIHDTEPAERLHRGDRGQSS